MVVILDMGNVPAISSLVLHPGLPLLISELFLSSRCLSVVNSIEMELDAVPMILLLLHCSVDLSYKKSA